MGNNKKSRTCGGDLFVIALLAAAAGAIMGLLFAPQSGAKTRKVVSDAIDETIDRGKFFLLEARVMGEELAEKGREGAEKLSSKVKSIK